MRSLSTMPYAAVPRGELATPAELMAIQRDRSGLAPVGSFVSDLLKGVAGSYVTTLIPKLNIPDVLKPVTTSLTSMITNKLVPQVSTTLPSPQAQQTPAPAPAPAAGVGVNTSAMTVAPGTAQGPGVPAAQTAEQAALAAAAAKAALDAQGSSNSMLLLGGALLAVVLATRRG